MLGFNYYGQLGIGSQANSLTPQAVNLGTGRTALSVSVGPSHTCAILDDGSLKCWGAIITANLGIGSLADSLIPQSINLGSGRTAKSVDLGGSHTCAILDNGVQVLETVQPLEPVRLQCKSHLKQLIWEAVELRFR